MSGYINVGGQKKEIVDIFGNVNGEKKRMISGWAKINGEIKNIYSTGGKSVWAWVAYSNNSCIAYKFSNAFAPDTAVQYVIPVNGKTYADLIFFNGYLYTCCTDGSIYRTNDMINWSFIQQLDKIKARPYATFYKTANRLYILFKVTGVTTEANYTMYYLDENKGTFETFVLVGDFMNSKYESTTVKGTYLTYVPVYIASEQSDKLFYLFKGNVYGSGNADAVLYSIDSFGLIEKVIDLPAGGKTVYWDTGWYDETIDRVCLLMNATNTGRNVYKINAREKSYETQTVSSNIPGTNSSYAVMTVSRNGVAMMAYRYSASSNALYISRDNFKTSQRLLSNYQYLNDALRVAGDYIFNNGQSPSYAVSNYKLTTEAGDNFTGSKTVIHGGIDKGIFTT